MVLRMLLLFMSIQNLKLTKRLTCLLLLKVQVQDVRFARWCARRQLCSSVKWLLIVLSVGSIFSDERTASPFTVDTREVRLRHISCELFPLVRTEIWLL